MSIFTNDIVYFWSKVQKHKNCCWIWTTRKDIDGYGRFGLRGKSWRAHRFAYHITYGDPGSLCVLHKCDNPCCVRPDHLFLGTNNDNRQDSKKKGRCRGGYPSKLTRDQVRLIRKLCQQGYFQYKIAKKYKIAQSTVSHIVNRRLFKKIA